MAWTYSGYKSQPTLSARLTMARQHHQELSDAITADVQGGGKAKWNTPLTTMLSMVAGDIEKYEAQLGEDHVGPQIVAGDWRGCGG